MSSMGYWTNYLYLPYYLEYPHDVVSSVWAILVAHKFYFFTEKQECLEVIKLYWYHAVHFKVSLLTHERN